MEAEKRDPGNEVVSNIAVKYSEEDSISGEVSKIGKHRIEIGKVEGSDSIVTHSLTPKDSIVAYA